MSSENVPSSKNCYIFQKLKFNLLYSSNTFNFLSYLTINQYLKHPNYKFQKNYLILNILGSRQKKQLTQAYLYYSRLPFFVKFTSFIAFLKYPFFNICLKLQEI
jgi:hypothetical protein